MGTGAGMEAKPLSARAQVIRKDLEKMRAASRLAADDSMLDWIAQGVEEDEIAGIRLWDEPKASKKKGKA